MNRLLLWRWVAGSSVFEGCASAYLLQGRIRLLYPRQVDMPIEIMLHPDLPCISTVNPDPKRGGYYFLVDREEGSDYGVFMATQGSWSKPLDWIQTPYSRSKIFSRGNQESRIPTPCNRSDIFVMSMITPVFDKWSEFPFSGIIKSWCPPNLKLFSKANSKKSSTRRECKTCRRGFEIEVVY